VTPRLSGQDSPPSALPGPQQGSKRSREHPGVLAAASTRLSSLGGGSGGEGSWGAVGFKTARPTSLGNT
jgi:hypothetical protein